MTRDDDNDEQDDDEFNSRTFDQDRKDAASVCNPQIRSLLSDWYGVPEERLIHVEGAKDGEYAPGVNDLVDWFDYRGVDWIVPQDGHLIPVGERLRTGATGESPAVRTGYASNDDGSRYQWFKTCDLLMQECQQAVWCGLGGENQ